MVKKAQKLSRERSVTHAACVIHGTLYDWRYVERLYNMLDRNLHGTVHMHVYTEHDRSVPPHMSKHILTEWPGIAGPRKSWWYKLQMFDATHFKGDLLYFDLDTVICNDITWMVQQPTDYLWTIRDFRNLQRSAHNSMNSSIMWWNTERFAWIWDQVKINHIAELTRKYAGDQDFLHAVIDHNSRRYFDPNRVKSWRWQALDGGYDFARRRHCAPGSGTMIDGETSVLVFHGRPKPHQVTDPIILQHWR